MRTRRVLAVLLGVLGLLVMSVPSAGATADPLWVEQYGPTMIGAPTAWQKSTGKGVTVAVIDSGIDVDHPDLKANLDTVNDRDFGCNDDNPDDDATGRDSEGKLVKGHGTHVAGTIGAVANNGEGVAGVAYDVKLMGLKMPASDSNCDSPLSLASNAASAINWAVDHGAKVINLSYTEIIAGLVETIVEPCNSAYSRGTLCVVAAGNSGETRSSGFPYEWNAIVVTANDSAGRHASFAQKADTKWSVSAPGVGIVNTWPIDDPAHNGYHSIAGTSMATPHVAGAAALLFATGLKAPQVVQKLLETAGPTRDTNLEGAGLIHVERALGLESPQSVATGGTAAKPTGSAVRGGRTRAGGGSAAIIPTTTVPESADDGSRVAFEEGIATGDDSNDFDAIRLKEASRNSADRPFNVIVPLIGLSVIGAVFLVMLAVPRLRSKDVPPLT